MSKVVIFTIASGNFEEGFPVTLQIREESSGVYKEEIGEFPAAPDIPGLYNEFQQNYQNEDWNTAINEFRNSLKQTRNDPESLIYLNNAIAAGKKGQDNIHIAVSVPITGNPDVAKRILRGIAHAQSKVNCGSVDNIVQIINSNQTPNCTGTINNRQLQVEIVDDRNDKDTAEQVARKLVNDDDQKDIIAVIGHYRSELTKGAINLGYMDKILVISPTSTSTQLSNLPPYSVLRTVTSDTIAIADLNNYINKKIPSKSIKAVIAYNAGESYSESIKDKFIEITNQSDENKYDLKTFDAKQIINEARKINANVLLLAPSGTKEVLNQALELIKEASNIQNNKLILLGTSTLHDPATLDTDFGLKAEQTKLVIAVPWQKSEPPADPSNFEKEFSSIWEDTDINWATVMSYDAVQVVTKGLSTITGQPTRQSLKDSILNNLDNFIAEGATTTIQFYTKQDKGSRKPDGNGKRLGVVVKVQCQNSTCNFIEQK